MGLTDLEQEQDAIEWRGWQHPPTLIVGVTRPAAGGGWTYIAPATAITLVKTVSFTIVTSSQAATRIPVVTVKDGSGNTMATVPSPYTLAASKTSLLTFAVGLYPYGANDGARIGQALPPLYLQGGYQVVVSTDAEDAGDQISGVTLGVEQWHNRAPLGV